MKDKSLTLRELLLSGQIDEEDWPKLRALLVQKARQLEQDSTPPDGSSTRSAERAPSEAPSENREPQTQQGDERRTLKERLTPMPDDLRENLSGRWIVSFGRGSSQRTSGSPTKQDSTQPTTSPDSKDSSSR